MARRSSSTARTRAPRRSTPRCSATTSRSSCRRRSHRRSRCSRCRAPDDRMLSPTILVPAILNGLMTGAVYALVALGLTLIYGVLHIINFAHGALLTAAMFAAFFAHRLLGLDPYLAAIALTPLFFA